jgi:hypothetical protein
MKKRLYCDKRNAKIKRENEREVKGEGRNRETGSKEERRNEDCNESKGDRKREMEVSGGIEIIGR